MTPPFQGARYRPAVTHTPRSFLVLLALLCGCAGTFDPIVTDSDPFGDFTPPPEVTPAPPVTLTVTSPSEGLRSLDGGFVATNDGRSWADLSALTDDGPFALASVIEVRGTLGEWLLPSDGGNPSAAENGIWAGYVAEAIAAQRYAAIRITLASADDLPAAWPTTTDPPPPIADGVISLLSYGDEPGDDDDSAGDDDDSAGDDDDSASGARELVHYVNWTDPDVFQLHGAVVAALAARFADDPGLAFVTVGGVGANGMWELPPEVPPVGGGGVFTEASWFSLAGLTTEIYRGSFPSVPAYMGWRVLAQAGPNQDALLSTLRGDDVHLRDDCFGGCAGADWDRFPAEGSADPFPASDPFGGWLPGAVDDIDLMIGGGLQGIGGWRRAEVSGSWDVSAFGAVTEHLHRSMEIAARYAQPRWVSLGEDACMSAWAVAATPSGSACSPQSGAWTELGQYGWANGDRPAVGARPELRAVTVPGNWEELGLFTLSITLVNAGSAPLIPRALDLRLVGDDGEEWAAATASIDPLSAGSEVSLQYSISPETATPPASLHVEVRSPEERAFGGFMPLLGDAQSDGWFRLGTLQ